MDPSLEMGWCVYLGLIARHLTHPHSIVRGDAAWALVNLGAQAGRTDVVDRVLPYRDDPDSSVRLKVAYRLSRDFPDRFYSLDLGRSLHESLWPFRPDDGTDD